MDLKKTKDNSISVFGLFLFISKTDLAFSIHTVYLLLKTGTTYPTT